MNKKFIKLTESELKKVIKESAMRIIREGYGQETTPDEVVAQIDGYCRRGGVFAFEFTDIVDENGEPYGYIQLGYDPETNILYGGGTSNVGVKHDFEMEYDHSLSLDQNIQGFYEQIQEELINDGYFWVEQEDSF